MSGGVRPVAVQSAGTNDPIGRWWPWALMAWVASGLFMAWWLHWFSLIDLKVYRAGASAFLHGRDVYLAHPRGSGLLFTYPPFAAIVFAPLAVLPDVGARVAMTLASAAALLFAALTLVRLAGPNWSARSRWTAALAIGAATPLFEPLRDTFRLGQINLVLMALVLADLAGGDGAEGTRSRRSRGVLIGLATAIKLTPAIFILYLLTTRRVREAVVAIGTACVAVGAAAVVMPSASIRYWTRLVFDDRRVGNSGSVWNQSVRGALDRLAGSSHAHLLWLGVAAALLVLGLALAAWFHRSGDELMGVGLAGLTGLLISPISWNHHWVWALPVAIGLWRRWAVTRAPQLLGMAVGWLAVFGLASISWWTFAGPNAFVPGTLHQVEAGCYVIAALALLAVVGLAPSGPRAWWHNQAWSGATPVVSARPWGRRRTA
jgi:alpha-1,2-mannosyltransferase